MPKASQTNRRIPLNCLEFQTCKGPPLLHYGCANKGMSVSMPSTANGRDSSLRMTLPGVGMNVYACYLRRE